MSTQHFAECPVSTMERDCLCRAEVKCQVSGYQIGVSVLGDIHFGLNVSVG